MAVGTGNDVSFIASEKPKYPISTSTLHPLPTSWVPTLLTPYPGRALNANVSVRNNRESSQTNGEGIHPLVHYFLGFDLRIILSARIHKENITLLILKARFDDLSISITPAYFSKKG